MILHSDNGVGGFHVHPVPQGAIWPSVFANSQEGKMAIGLSLHGKLDVVQVVEEFLSSSGLWGQVADVSPT
jgi:hypothetical protein